MKSSFRSSVTLGVVLFILSIVISPAATASICLKSDCKSVVEANCKQAGKENSQFGIARTGGGTTVNVLCATANTQNSETYCTNLCDS